MRGGLSKLLSEKGQNVLGLVGDQERLGEGAIGGLTPNGSIG